MQRYPVPGTVAQVFTSGPARPQAGPHVTTFYLTVRDARQAANETFLAAESLRLTAAAARRSGSAAETSGPRDRGGPGTAKASPLDRPHRLISSGLACRLSRWFRLSSPWEPLASSHLAPLSTVRGCLWAGIVLPEKALASSRSVDEFPRHWQAKVRVIISLPPPSSLILPPPSSASSPHSLPHSAPTYPREAAKGGGIRPRADHLPREAPVARFHWAFCLPEDKTGTIPRNFAAPRAASLGGEESEVGSSAPWDVLRWEWRNGWTINYAVCIPPTLSFPLPSAGVAHAHQPIKGHILSWWWR